MKKAVEQCMLDFEITESGDLRSRFVFPEDFIGFQGHFPDNKILPAISQVQCVMNTIEKYKGRRAVLHEIIMAKFLSPVLPSEELVCTGKSVEEDNEGMVLKAFLSKDGKRTAEIKLRVRFE